MSKQDRTYTRTATDLEQKYNFGKTFAEVFGMAEDAQKAAEKAQKAADDATGAVGDLDQDAIFNLLTNNGEIKGLFMKDGQLYINASYLVTGVIKSENGKLVIDLSGEPEPTFNTGISTNGLTIRADVAGQGNLVFVEARQTNTGTYYGDAYFNSTNGINLVRLTEDFTDISKTEPAGVSMEFFNQPHTRSVKIDAGELESGVWVKKDGSPIGYLATSKDGKSWLQADVINGKLISWKDNGDGTFTLIGR